MSDKEEPNDDFELPSQMLFSQMQRYFDNQYQNEVVQRVKQADDDEMAYVKTPPHNDNQAMDDNIFNEIIEDEDTTDGTDLQPDQTTISKPREAPPLFLVNNTTIEDGEPNINTVEQSSGSGHLYQSPVTTQQLMHDINIDTIDNISPIPSKEIPASNNNINMNNNNGIESDAEMDEIMAFIENNKVEAKVINAPEIDLDLDPDQFVELMKDRLADVPLDQVQIQLEEFLSQKSNSTPPVNNVHSNTAPSNKNEEKNSQKETNLPVIMTSTPPAMKTPSQSDISNSTNDKSSTPDPLSTTPIVQKMDNFVQSQIPVPENNIVLPYKLNDEQLKAVQSPFNIPLMIAAGPGSGKTLTLVCRIVHMLSNNISSNSIVAITFTRKAANEMRDRIERVSKSLNIQTTLGLTICTFHQFCLKVLRLHSHLLTSDLKKFEVYTRRKQEDVLLRCFTEWNNQSNSQSQTSQGSQDQQPFELKMPEGGGEDHKKLIRSCFTLIRKIKANPCNPKNIANPFFRFIYRKYNEIMNAAGGIDFNDFISKTVELFSKHPEVLQKYQKIYQQVLVDEFQDISSMQWELLKLLTGQSGHITAVGDVDQSIYSFRGATVKNFEHFNDQFPQKILIRLNQNYRSTKSILQCASEVIKNNMERPNATAMYTNNENGKRIVLVLSKTPREEIISILDIVQQMKDNEGFKLRDMAILYRNRYIGKAFEPELRRRKINFGLNGKVSFYHYSEVLDILAYLRLIIDENDDAAFKRIFNVPTRGLGTKTLKTVEKTATMRRISLFKAAKKVLEYNSDVKNQQQRGLKILLGLLDKIRDSTDFEKKSLSEIIKLVIERTKYQNYLWKLADDRNRNKENGLTDEEDALDGIDEENLTDDFDDEDMLQEKSGEPIEMKNLSRLIQEANIFVQEYYKWKTSYHGQQQQDDSENNELDESRDGMKSVEKTETFKMLKLFLTQVSYDVKETDEKDQLTLSTIHQSKGLEWPIVFLVHVNEGYLPSKHFGEKIAMKSSQGVSKSIGEDEYTMIEEERRLCYVAMTRAEQQLIISTFAEENGIKSVSSRFLEEIPKDQCDTVNKIPKEKSSAQIKQKNNTINVNSSDKSSFQIKRIEVEQSQLPPMLRPQNVSPKKANTNTITPKKNSPQKRKSPTTTVQSPTSHMPSRQKTLKQTESAKKKIDFSRHNEFTSAREVSEEDSSSDNYLEGEDKDPDEIKDDDEEDEGNTEKQNESGPTVDDLAALIESEDSASSVTLQQSSKKSQSPVKEVPGPVGLSKLMDARVRSPGLRRKNKRRHSACTAADVLPANEFESPLKKQKTSLGHSTNVNKDR